MSYETPAYYRALKELNWAMSERKYRQAFVALKAGIRVMRRQLRAMSKDGTTALVYTGSLIGAGGAVAALMNNSKEFDLMDDISTYFVNPSKLGIEQLRQDGAAIERIRETLRTTTEVSLDGLKRAADPEVRGRLSRLISWMEKNSELSVEKLDDLTIVRAGPSVRKPTVVDPTFRDGQTPCNPVQVWLPPFEDEDEDEDEDENEGNVKVARSTHRLAPSERLPGVMHTYALRGGFWLVGYPRTLPNGESQTKIIVKSRVGETLRSFVLKQYVVRVFSSFQRENIIILDSTLGVAVLDLMGRHIHGFSLAKNPEVQSVLRTLREDTKPRNTIRGIDISPTSGDIAFSVVDHVWRFTSDGSLVSAFHLTLHNPTEMSEALVLAPGKSLALPHAFEGEFELHRDWIYFLRISDHDDSMFISRYSGDLINIPRYGECKRRWDIFAPAEDILESEDQIIASTWSGTSVISADGSISRFPYSGTFYSETQLVGGGLFNPKSQTGADVFPEGRIQGLYPVAGKLRVETRAEYFDVEFP
ncbi:hypothetical protein I6E68_09455 [Salinibacterium sp. NSLL150]|uniref:hypothetical protein n=1 Tax=unclassified Salinibacterium TaxID=2632331 RepID=UPI0018CFDACF|nr:MULTISPECIES: hypothetical protein [unclassified Salinibacterium]MBH0099365.1 hypothetical protein [Salinibacterium sp. NSLL35]MBH0102119.1 hypothetical protein [Salinibacterium sp. NSLL150]MBH0104879.1 hypothetical protein [Salinibacterium sp. NSLL16]MBH0107639.1 hypothetical protein [Salinibacterium sp. NSLL17]